MYVLGALFLVQAVMIFGKFSLHAMLAQWIYGSRERWQ